MKTNRFQNLLRGITLSLGIVYSVCAQAQDYSIGSSASILGQLISSGKTSTSQHIQISANQSFELNINISKLNNGSANISGAIANKSNSSFYLQGNAKNLNGAFILRDQKQAYTLTTDAYGNAHIAASDINKLLCTELQEHHEKTSIVRGNNTLAGTDISNLQSWPSASATVLLDFDGQVVNSIYWNNGSTINAAPSGFSDVLIQQIWEMMSEDYRPFNLNITTSESVYNAAPANQRMRIIFTPTNTAAPGSGGVAYIGSFSWGNETPCWVFNGGLKGAGEAGSHELGHTVGLRHDGRNSPAEQYYGGNGNWAPIMGVGYYVNMVQFSKGEYPAANNQEDDIAIISNGNGFTFRSDDYSNFPSSATAIDPDHNGSVLINGVIEKQSDQDVFSFQTSGGSLNLYAHTASAQPNLDIALTLTTANGTILQTISPDDILSATLIFPNLPAGTYYVYLDGVGKPSVNTYGYSDYASIGSFIIEGTVPPYSATNQAPTVVITNPIAAQHFAANANIPINVTANDVDGSVVKVEIFDNSTLLATLTAAPYSINFSSNTVGSHRLSAIAYDNGAPQLFTVSAPVVIYIDPISSGVCTGSAANGDYTYEAGKSNGSTEIKFIPGTPIAGCTAALIYYKIDNGAIIGAYMEASGSNFIKTFSAPAGSIVTFYFTYRAGNTGIERNSSLTPHSFTVGNCDGVINNPPGCTGSAANGDYTYEANSQSGVSSIKFIPGAPIAGCNMALIYYKIDNGGIIGTYMDPSGANFTKSISVATGSTLTFYFTYRVGTTGAERNSSAAPHSFVVGNCGANAQAGEATNVENIAAQNIAVYPNPTQNQLNVQFSNPTEGKITIEMSDIFNRVVLHNEQKYISSTVEINTTTLDNGLYFLHISNGSSDIVKQIVIQK